MTDILKGLKKLAEDTDKFLAKVGNNKTSETFLFDSLQENKKKKESKIVYPDSWSKEDE